MISTSLDAPLRSFTYSSSFEPLKIPFPPTDLALFVTRICIALQVCKGHLRTLLTNSNSPRYLVDPLWKILKRFYKSCMNCVVPLDQMRVFWNILHGIALMSCSHDSLWKWIASGFDASVTHVEFCNCFSFAWQLSVNLLLLLSLLKLHPVGCKSKILDASI